MINLALLSIKFLLITLEFFYKNHILGATPTVLDGDNGTDIESAESSEDVVTCAVNPILEMQAKAGNEKKPHSKGNNEDIELGSF